MFSRSDIQPPKLSATLFTKLVTSTMLNESARTEVTIEKFNPVFYPIHFLHRAALQLTISVDQPRHIDTSQCQTATSVCGIQKLEDGRQFLSLPESTRRRSGSDCVRNLLNWVGGVHWADTRSIKKIWRHILKTYTLRKPDTGWRQTWCLPRKLPKGEVTQTWVEALPFKLVVFNKALQPTEQASSQFGNIH